MAGNDDIIASLRVWAPLVVKWAAAPAAGQVMENAATEIERLRDLFRLDGEQHAQHIKGLTEAHEARITKYATALAERDATIERLTAHSAARAQDIITLGQQVAQLTKERDEARQIVRDIYWMALRYADGRYTYAVSMVNDAVEKAYAGGWLEHKHQVDPAFARDGDGPEWQSTEARAATAERERDEARAEVERKDAALSLIAEGRGFCETCGTLAKGPGPGVTDCDCARPTWAPSDPQKIARAALTAKGGENAEG